MAGISAACLGAGIGLAQLVESPGEAAAKAAPPKAGAITAPVEKRTIANVVTIRGDVVYDDATDVSVLTSDLTGPAIVTARPPKAGSTLTEGSVMAQVTGRPVIVLEGALPTYRTLRVGAEGPDVAQLKKALVRLGIDPGNNSDTFDVACSGAVGRLYEKVGYAPPEPAQADADALKGAQSAARDARTALKQAKGSLADSRKKQADPRELHAAERAEADAKASYRAAKAKTTCTAKTSVSDCYPSRSERTLAITLARNALDQATKDLRAVKNPPTQNLGELQRQVETAQTAVTDAEDALDEARERTLPSLPSAEVVYVTKLPRRVDQVLVSYGKPVEGPLLKVSGATLRIKANASADQAELIAKGDRAEIQTPEAGSPLTATIASVGKAKDGQDEMSAVTLTLPDSLSAAQAAALRGQNVKIRIPVESTDGAVLAVPVAALFAGPGGESRVTRQAPDGSTTVVEVEQGLAANGFVEVTPKGGTLAEGDLVVVGTA